jgi:hypothetical protein
VCGFIHKDNRRREEVRIVEPNQQDLIEWEEWKATRPKLVKEIADKLDPWTLYQMKDTRQYVSLIAIAEDGTIRVQIPAKYNMLQFVDLEVFGINPDNLAACTELPTEQSPIEEENGVYIVSLAATEK